MSEKSSQEDIIHKKPFFYREGVKQSKKLILKNRLKLLIEAKGMKESEFYNRELQISKQLWYYISWGIWKPSNYLMVKIAKALDTDSSVIFGDIDYSDVQHQLNEPTKQNEN